MSVLRHVCASTVRGASAVHPMRAWCYFSRGPSDKVYSVESDVLTVVTGTQITGSRATMQFL